MRTYTVVVDVHAPAHRVWEFLADVLAWPRNLSTVTAVESLSGGALIVGARFRVTQPKIRPATWEVTSVEPGRSFIWQSRSPGIEMDASHVIEPISDSKCKLRLDFSFSGALDSIAAFFYGSLTQRYVAMEGQSFKYLAEAADAAGSIVRPISSAYGR